MHSFYNEARSNEPFFIEGSLKFLEISLKNKSAKDFFCLKGIDNKIIIRS